MGLTIEKEVAALGRMTVKELRVRYAEALGEQTQANNKAWPVKRIAWRLQARAEGDLTAPIRVQPVFGPAMDWNDLWMRLTGQTS